MKMPNGATKAVLYREQHGNVPFRIQEIPAGTRIIPIVHTNFSLEGAVDKEIPTFEEKFVRTGFPCMCCGAEYYMSVNYGQFVEWQKEQIV